MPAWLKTAIVAVVLVCVLVVMIAPNVDLPQANLRSWQFAQAVLMAVSLLLLLELAFRVQLLVCCWHWQQAAPRATLAKPALLCSFLC